MSKREKPLTAKTTRALIRAKLENDFSADIWARRCSQQGSAVPESQALPALLEAKDAWKWLEDSDCGGASVRRFEEGELHFYFLGVTTDGDDTWVETYDERGVFVIGFAPGGVVRQITNPFTKAIEQIGREHYWFDDVRDLRNYARRQFTAPRDTSLPKGATTSPVLSRS